MSGILKWLPLVLSSLALFLVIFHDPLGPIYRMRWNALGLGIGGYDYSTPSKALHARLEIESNRDVRAALEMSRFFEQKELKEKLDTLKVEKEKIVKLPERGSGKKGDKNREVTLLFVTYKKDGEDQYKVEGSEKHKESGLWKPLNYVGSYEVRETDEALAKEMEEWEAKGKK
jgi:hypothetical protein